MTDDRELHTFRGFNFRFTQADEKPKHVPDEIRVNILEALADDPDNPLEKMEDGRYIEHKDGWKGMER